MNPGDVPARYLPAEIAEYLRTILVRVPDAGARAELIAAAEMAFQHGHGQGYERGFLDGGIESATAAGHDPLGLPVALAPGERPAPRRRDGAAAGGAS